MHHYLPPLIVLGLVLLAQPPCLNAAQGSGRFRPQISSRTIPLNGIVQIRFSTMPPQVEEVDPVTAVRNALTTAAVRRDWRLHGEAEIDQHPRARDVTVAFSLMPRRTGEIMLPTIPVSWMGRDQFAELGTVVVEPSLRMGTESLPLPPQIEQIAGHAWGTSASDLADVYPSHRFLEAGETRPASILVNEHLQLILRRDHLAEAWLNAREVQLEAALEHFIDRWGDPLVNESRHPDEPHIIWQIGWLRIHAMSHPVGGTRLHFLHEGIARQLVGSAVASDVFAVLDGRSRSVQPSDDKDAVDDHSEDDEDSAPSEAPTTSDRPQIPDDDIRRELERALRQQSR